MSTVRRVNRPADQFVMISNGFARDERLSLEAIGLGVWLLSHVEGWETSVQAICTRTRTGRDRVSRILNELEDAGYLRRVQERDDYGRMAAMVYEIQCTPFDGETPGGTGTLKTRKRVSRIRPTGTHKKTTLKKTTQEQKTDPSGGETAAAAPRSLEVSPIHEQRQEDAVAPAADSLALFDVPAPTKAQKAESPSAKTVTAAYVDSYRSAHSGGEPLKRSIGRVARDAKAMLDRAEAGPSELVAAAQAMGKGPYDNLSMALKISRERMNKAGKQAGVPARPHTDAHWLDAEARVESQWYQDLLTQDDAIEWARRDPAEVARLVATYPDLAARFESVA